MIDIFFYISSRNTKVENYLTFLEVEEKTFGKPKVLLCLQKKKKKNHDLYHILGNHEW